MNLFEDEELNDDEFMSQEIPKKINYISEIRARIHLRSDLERILQKLPTLFISEDCPKLILSITGLLNK